MPPSCAFCSSESTRSGTPGLQPSCRACEPDHDERMVLCNWCKPVDACTWRAVRCYHKFARAMRERVPQVEKGQDVRLLRTPLIAALLDEDWVALMAPSTAPRSSLLTVRDDGNLQWTHACPSCEDALLPRPEPEMPPGYADLSPAATTDGVYDFESVEYMDRRTGNTLRRPVRLEVVTANAVVPESTARLVQFRDAVMPQHDNYLHIWRCVCVCETIVLSCMFPSFACAHVLRSACAGHPTHIQTVAVFGVWCALPQRRGNPASRCRLHTTTCCESCAQSAECRTSKVSLTRGDARSACAARATKNARA